EESAACYKQILTQQPNNADLLLNYGSLLREQGKPLEAETLYRQALAGDPSSAAAHFNLGNALRDQGRLQEAITSYRQAITLNPGCAAWYSNLGNALRDCGATEESLPIYEQALALDPDNVEALINLGNARKEGGAYGEAVAAYERARALRPDLAEIHFNLGTAFQDLCCLPEALACYRQALHLKPDHVIAHSNLLMNLQYDPAATPESILTESLQWAQQHTATIGTMSHDSATADPNRRLRIGYVSGDLRRHPIGYFLDGVLAHHDRECWEIFCYANQSFGDDLTERLRGNTTSWREIFGETDETVAEMIRGDAIDILIDLAGHTARNRLLAFARKPAPVQATWAGYVGTTGLAAMDYLISDLQETPLGTESWYREALIRLPDCYVCYAPP
ncbi:tetratricopeptide repeat protein, partial [bacterium]